MSLGFKMIIMAGMMTIPLLMPTILLFDE